MKKEELKADGPLQAKKVEVKSEPNVSTLVEKNEKKQKKKDVQV